MGELSDAEALAIYRAAYHELRQDVYAATHALREARTRACLLLLENALERHAESN